MDDLRSNVELARIISECLSEGGSFAQSRCVGQAEAAQVEREYSEADDALVELLRRLGVG